MRRAPIALAVTLVSALAAAASAEAQTFRRPTACGDCIAGWYYFDEDGGGGVQDWSCAASSYDGHRGTDFSLAGGNGAIDAGHDLVAAADGVVVSTVDGHYDRCRTCDASVDGRCGLGFGGGFGNHVVINHGSYRVVYAHMRQGSVRVTNGQTVRCGDVIGQIGSSGCTTGAHVHFETRPLGGASATAFDPFAGMCSPTSPSRWVSQGPHRGLPGPECDGTPVCPAGTFPIWTCDAGRTSRRRCVDGNDMTEACPYGCVSMPVGTDDVCAPPPDADGDGAAADVDCDDGDPGRYPGLAEVCGDGVDQDCDGEDLACGVDAGVPGGDAGLGADAGPSSDAGQGADAGDGPRDAGDASGRLVGGCSCRAAGPRRAAPLSLALALGLAFAFRRRACAARRSRAAAPTRPPPSRRRRPRASA